MRDESQAPPKLQLIYHHPEGRNEQRPSDLCRDGILQPGALGSRVAPPLEGHCCAPQCPWVSLGVPGCPMALGHNAQVEGANFPPADHLSLKSHLFTIVLFLSN